MISSAGVNEIEAIELNGVVVIYSLEKWRCWLLQRVDLSSSLMRSNGIVFLYLPQRNQIRTTYSQLAALREKACNSCTNLSSMELLIETLLLQVKKAW